MPTYQAQRGTSGWIVVATTNGEVVGTNYGAGKVGAANAQAAAEALNRNEQRAAKNGAMVKAWRKRLGLSQARLSEQLGVALFTVQRWESGESEPPAYLFLAFERLEQLL